MTAPSPVGRRRPAADDAGVVGGAEVLPLAVLTFVVGTLLLANLWAVVDGRVAAEAAAREAVRVYVEAPDAATGVAAAHQAASTALAGHGRSPERLSLTVEHPDGRPFARCVPVVARARYPVALAVLPLPGARTVSFTVTATAAERIDPWRSGLPGATSC